MAEPGSSPTAGNLPVRSQDRTSVADPPLSFNPALRRWPLAMCNGHYERDLERDFSFVVERPLPAIPTVTEVVVQ
jgi:hypothetical protein